MDNLISKLNALPNAYYEFIDSVIDFAESKASHFELLTRYLDEHKSVTPSDIIKLISSQPDFFDDDAPTDIDSLVS